MKPVETHVFAELLCGESADQEAIYAANTIRECLEMNDTSRLLNFVRTSRDRVHAERAVVATIISDTVLRTFWLDQFVELLLNDRFYDAKANPGMLGILPGLFRASVWCDRHVDGETFAQAFVKHLPDIVFAQNTVMDSKPDDAYAGQLKNVVRTWARGSGNERIKAERLADVQRVIREWWQRWDEATSRDPKPAQTKPILSWLGTIVLDELCYEFLSRIGPHGRAHAVTLWGERITDFVVGDVELMVKSS